jgi:diaminopropionate ammonia-lyase
VARAARDAGCKARVYMAHDVAQARVDAIAGEGAEVVRVTGSYDDAVRLIQDHASTHGWTIVSDTAWEGYEEIPRLIMQGYSRMMDEVFRDQGSGTSDQRGADIVFVQGGVGGLLCGVASWCARYRPDVRVVCVEPTSSACLQASARAEKPVAATGPLNTAMTGLRNREVSTTGFAAAFQIVNAFVSIDDAWAEEAMRALHVAGIRAGASGAAALGGLLAVMRDASMGDVRSELGLGPASRVMAIISEGVTDPAHWSSVVEAA